MDIAAMEPWPDVGASRPRRAGCSRFLVVPLAIVLLAGTLAVMALRLHLPAGELRAASADVAAISNVFTPQVRAWDPSIRNWANEAGLDPNLIAVVMQIESCGDPWAASSAGALGLFQVMPYHFVPADDPYDPDTNSSRALDYLGQSLAAAQGNVQLALAGYNGGIGLISEPDWSWPAETQRYTYWGSGIYADASSGASQSARLLEWLAAGGEALCQRAAAGRINGG